MRKTIAPALSLCIAAALPVRTVAAQVTIPTVPPPSELERSLAELHVDLRGLDAVMAAMPRAVANFDEALAAMDAALMAAGPALQAAEPALVAAGPSLMAAEPALKSVGPMLEALGPTLSALGPTMRAMAPALLAGAGTLRGHDGAWRPQSNPRPAWAPQDPADSLYRAARESLNRSDYTRAAELFGQILSRHPGSTYAPDAYYWRAFALYRTGGGQALRTAIEVLETQRARYPDAATRVQAETLATRIRGELARLGDAESAEMLTRSAAGEGVEACDADEDDVRAAALNALLQMDAGRALPILEQVLARRDACSAPLRRKAVFLISQADSPETADILLDLARNDPDREVRSQAVFWLSQVDTEKAVAALEDILRNGDDAEIHEKAIFALSQHHSEEAARILRDYAVRPDAPRNVRENAIFWIGQSRSAENAQFLRDLYAELKDAELKEKIIFSLSQMRGVGNERWLMRVVLDESQSIEARKNALFWAGQAGAPIEELTGLYDRIRGREMKEQLIFVYSQRRDAAAVDKLIEIARSEPDQDLRKKAIFWLGQSKDPRAAQALLEIINHG